MNISCPAANFGQLGYGQHSKDTLQSVHTVIALLRFQLMISAYQTALNTREDIGPVQGLLPGCCRLSAGHGWPPREEVRDHFHLAVPCKHPTQADFLGRIDGVWKINGHSVRDDV